MNILKISDEKLLTPHRFWLILALVTPMQLLALVPNAERFKSFEDHAQAMIEIKKNRIANKGLLDKGLTEIKTVGTIGEL